jgi:hypothetical protein
MPEPQVPEFFESEEKRQEFIDGIDETPENMAVLEKAMETEIREASAETEPTPEPEPKKEPEPSPEPKKEPAPEPEPKPSAEPTPAPKEFTVKSEELPEGFDTPGKVFKTLKEQGDLIGRQQRYIQEKLDGATGSEELQRQAARADTAEAELAELKGKVSKLEQAGGKPAPSTEKEIEVAESKLDRINVLVKEIADLQEGGKDSLDTEVATRSRELIQLQAEETKRLNDLTSRTTQEIADFRREMGETRTRVETLVTSSTKNSEQAQAAKALGDDLKQIDTFASDHADDGFKLAKSANELDGEYKVLRERGATLYYGRKPINAQERNVAMQQFQAQAPSLIEACKAAGISVEPAGDLKVYLDICKLMDEADGYYQHPVTGQQLRRTKYDAASRKHMPDTYPSVEAYYQHKLVSDGKYAELVQNARRAGGKAALAAASQRDPEVIKSGEGASREQAGLEVSPTDALKIVEETDEEEAVSLARAKDRTLWDKYVAACNVLVKNKLMDAGAVPTLEDIGVTL